MYLILTVIEPRMKMVDLANKQFSLALNSKFNRLGTSLCSGTNKKDYETYWGDLTGGSVGT